MVYVHPKYRNIQNKPIYDVALIEVMRPLRFGRFLKPINLPPVHMWTPFYGRHVSVYGYGRVEQVQIRGQDQTACQTMRGDLTIRFHKLNVCSKVII